MNLLVTCEHFTLLGPTNHVISSVSGIRILAWTNQSGRYWSKSTQKGSKSLFTNNDNHGIIWAICLPFARPFNFQIHETVFWSWLFCNPHSSLIAASSSADTPGGGGGGAIALLGKTLPFFFLVLIFPGSASAPQPLYNMTLVGSWDTRTAPVASCVLMKRIM